MTTYGIFRKGTNEMQTFYVGTKTETRIHLTRLLGEEWTKLYDLKKIK